MPLRAGDGDRLVRLVVEDPTPFLRWDRPVRRSTAAGFALGLALGGVAFALTPVRTSATTTVELTDVAPAVRLDESGRGHLVTVDTDAQILASDAVVRAVSAQGGHTVEEVRESLSVTARPLTRMLDIVYTAASPHDALVGSRDAASGLLAERQELVMQPLQTYLTEVLDRTEDVTPFAGAQEDADADSAAPRDSGVPESATAVELSRSRAIALLSQLASPGQVSEQARVTSAATRGDVEVPVGSGAATGTLLGLVLGSARQRRQQHRLGPRRAR